MSLVLGLQKPPAGCASAWWVTKFRLYDSVPVRVTPTFSSANGGMAGGGAVDVPTPYFSELIRRAVR